MELGIVWLVRVAWIAAILPMLIGSIPNSKLTSFHQLVLGFARRGKILQPSSSSQVFIKACHLIQLPSLLIRLKLMFQLQNHTIATLVWDLRFQFHKCSVSVSCFETMQKWTLPQKHFAHFYVLGVAWTTLLLAATWMYAFKMTPLTSDEFHLSKVWRAVFLLVLMEIQVLRRLMESFYVFKYSPSARMSILGYLAGLL